MFDYYIVNLTAAMIGHRGAGVRGDGGVQSAVFRHNSVRFLLVDWRSYYWFFWSFGSAGSDCTTENLLITIHKLVVILSLFYLTIL